MEHNLEVEPNYLRSNDQDNDAQMSSQQWFKIAGNILNKQVETYRSSVQSNLYNDMSYDEERNHSELTVGYFSNYNENFLLTSNLTRRKSSLQGVFSRISKQRSSMKKQDFDTIKEDEIEYPIAKLQINGRFKSGDWKLQMKNDQTLSKEVEGMLKLRRKSCCCNECGRQNKFQKRNTYITYLKVRPENLLTFTKFGMYYIYHNHYQIVYNDHSLVAGTSKSIQNSYPNKQISTRRPSMKVPDFHCGTSRQWKDQDSQRRLDQIDSVKLIPYEPQKTSRSVKISTRMLKFGQGKETKNRVDQSTSLPKMGYYRSKQKKQEETLFQQMQASTRLKTASKNQTVNSIYKNSLLPRKINKIKQTDILPCHEEYFQKPLMQLPQLQRKKIQ